MDLFLHIDIPSLPEPISYRDRIMLVGSCFTEHIGNTLHNLKFSVLQNPNGITFNPDSVCRSLLAYVQNKPYKAEQLFFLDELWHSWQHHSRFSHMDRSEALRQMNESQNRAHEFLKQASWLIITLGSAYGYRLTTEAPRAGAAVGEIVANNHRAPANWFKKEMIETALIVSMLEDCLGRLQQFNAGLKFIFTISPVRHARDGVVENNRSKARLIEAVQQVTEKSASVFYFPAYELVIDVLRDYRFYDIDLVHPNYAATEFVLEKFVECCIDEKARKLMNELKKISIARKHRPFQPQTRAHRDFLAAQLEKVKALRNEYPFLDLEEEIRFFSQYSNGR